MTASPHPSREELVVLADDAGRPLGTMPKSEVHHARTPLHLAFSCHLLDDQGRVLVTRRALGKIAWPGVWTNSCCGHPGPGESDTEAVRRRVRHELGMEITDVTPVLPDFRYRAVDDSGIVENEICPVYTARAASAPEPNPGEVASWQWVHPARLAAAVTAAPFAFSPWLCAQLAEMGLYAG